MFWRLKNLNGCLYSGNEFVRDVEAFIASGDLLADGDVVAVALSGGADSVALATVSKRERERSVPTASPTYSVPSHSRLTATFTVRALSISTWCRRKRIRAPRVGVIFSINTGVLASGSIFGGGGSEDWATEIFR